MLPKILIVDDEKDFTEIAGTMLSFYDYEAVKVNDPAKVIEELEKQKISLVITDLMMPHLDGFSLIHKIRSHEKYREVPILVLSAKMLTDEERKFLMQQKVHLLLKPFDPQGLVSLIQSLIQD